MQLIVVGALFLAVVGAGSARADGYPTKPIHMIVPLDAGSSADGIARIVLPSVSKILGQQIIIDNEGGAASISGYCPRSARTAGWLHPTVRHRWNPRIQSEHVLPTFHTTPEKTSRRSRAWPRRV